MIELIPQPNEAGQNILEWLAARIPAAPHSYLRRLLRKEKIRCAGEPLGESAAVQAGQPVQLSDSARLRELLDQAALPEVAIVFESRELLVALKPSGLAVHRGAGHEADNLTDRVQALLQSRRAPFRAAPIHRLDAETSGPVLFGKGRKAASELGKLFMAGAVEKTYLALASGTLEGAGRLESMVPAKGKLKASATDFRRLSGNRQFTLLELRLLSGRTHQIRRQLAELGHPLAGDRRFRGPAVAGLNRLFLHCCRLSLRDPFSGTPLLIEAPLPVELDRCLKQLAIMPPQGEAP
ncbi:RNA pseudouridine synthase [Desulfuromonas versatilis]|uniref:RNA pseudouridine synthase n=1 Tax=Desulfuromonas versatilis TaxID=2802975 RepID=A0ABM8HN81_9BACT|nr:RluA family pseudouridine synthase [Desulfuromonas versatilis]BCR04164.1 RNA pseudouridine synthase [Desulfuromonas versatilis]